MKLTATIEVPDNSTWQAIEDAKLSAKWHRVKTRSDLLKDTNLCNKCGSCKFFEATPHKANKSYGICHKGYVSPRPRSTKACTLYEASTKKERG